jgi:hypothetical protein
VLLQAEHACNSSRHQHRVREGDCVGVIAPTGVRIARTTQSRAEYASMVTITSPIWTRSSAEYPQIFAFFDLQLAASALTASSRSSARLSFVRSLLRPSSPQRSVDDASRTDTLRPRNALHSAHSSCYGDNIRSILHPSVPILTSHFLAHRRRTVQVLLSHLSQFFSLPFLFTLFRSKTGNPTLTGTLPMLSDASLP